MTVSGQIFDQLLADYKSSEDLLSEQGLLKQQRRHSFFRSACSEQVNRPDFLRQFVAS